VEFIFLKRATEIIGPKIIEKTDIEKIIQTVLKAWFSISIAPIDSSSSHCRAVIVHAGRKR
jgi:uncharacterized protein YlxP (DUF503 family)